MVHHRTPKSIVVAVNAAVKPPADASNVIAVIAESNSETGWANWSALATSLADIAEEIMAPCDAFCRRIRVRRTPDERYVS